MSDTLSPVPVMEDLYRFVPSARFSMGRSAELMYFSCEKTALAVDSASASLLESCSRFATVADHAAGIAARFPDAADAATAIVVEFVQAGLLLPYSRVRSAVDSFAEVRAPPAISTLAIPTSNRPKEVMRALDSYAAHLKHYGRSNRFVVAEGSLYGKDLRSALQTWSASSAFPVTYLDLSEKQRVIEMLARNGDAPRDVAEFGLLGLPSHSPTMGANRNCLLLETAGELVLNVDDDTVCRASTAVSGSTSAPIRPGSEGDPTEFWFFSDRESARHSASQLEVDVLASHEQLLGRRISDLVRQRETPNAYLDSACWHLVNSTCTGAGQVAVTLNGSSGDSGMYSGGQLARTRSSPTRQRMLASRESYSLALVSREVIRQVPSPTVCHSSPFISMFMGLDNRTLLPPFFPVGRGEDSVFGILLGRCFQESYFGYLPWCLAHEPPPGRIYAAHTSRDVRLCEILILCVISWQGPAHVNVPPAGRLTGLGRFLSELGSLSVSEFGEFLRIALWRRASQRIAATEELLATYGGQPDYWDADLRDDIDTLLAAAQEPGFAVPVDLSPELSDEVRLVLAQDLIRRYGELLQYWPAIFEKMRGLR